MRNVTVAATQFGCSWDLPANADHTGALMAKASRGDEEVLVHRFDLDAIADLRATWGIFRDRRPETYGVVAGLDGRRRQEF